MDEIELLKMEEAEAKASLRTALFELRHDLRTAVSPRGWVKERPLASLLVASGLGVTLGFGLGRMGKKLLESREQEKAPSRRGGRVCVVPAAAQVPPESVKPGLGSRIARWAMIGAREAFMLAFAVLGRTLRSSPEALEEAARSAAEERGEVLRTAEELRVS